MKKWKVSCDEKAYCPRRQENCCPCRPSVASWGWRRRKDTVAASRQCTAHTTNLEKWTSICPGIAHVPLNQQPIDFNILKSYVHSWCQWIQKHVAVVGSSYCFQNTLTYPTTIYIFFLPNIFRDQMGFPEVCFPWFFQPPPQDPQALMAKVEREDWTMKGWTYWWNVWIVNTSAISTIRVGQYFNFHIYIYICYVFICFVFWFLLLIYL